MDRKKREGNRKNILTIIVICIGIAGIAGTYFYFSGGGPSTSEETKSPRQTLRRAYNAVNERDAEELYDLFTENVKSKHQKAEIESYMELAKSFGVKILDWKVLNIDKTQNHAVVKVRENGIAMGEENIQINTYRFVHVEGRWLFNEWSFEEETEVGEGGKETEAKVITGAIGEEIELDNLEVTITESTSVDNFAENMGDYLWAYTPEKGYQFVLIHLSIRNLGKETIEPFFLHRKVITDKGYKYHARNLTDVKGEPIERETVDYTIQNLWFESGIQPKEKTDSYWCFRIPTGAKAENLQAEIAGYTLKIKL